MKRLLFRPYFEAQPALINLKSGSVFRAVIWRRRGAWLVLRSVELLSDRGQQVQEPAVMTGEALVLLADVDFIQLIS